MKWAITFAMTFVGLAMFATEVMGKRVCVCTPKVKAATETIGTSTVTVSNVTAPQVATSTYATSSIIESVTVTSSTTASSTTASSTTASIAAAKSAAPKDSAVPNGHYVSLVNSCATPVYYKLCFHAGEEPPITIAAGETLHVPMSDSGKAMKFTRGPTFPPGEIAFEYSIRPDGIYENLSHVDAEGLGPFQDTNVRLKPVGDKGENTCMTVLCAAGEPCEHSYKYWNNENTKFCPLEVTQFELEFCAQA